MRIKGLIFALLCLATAAGSAAEPSKGVSVVAVTDAEGRQVAFYEKSFALVIGVSDYTAGWPDLESVAGEIPQVAAALRSNGFEVTTVMDPDKARLESAFKDFIDRHGYDENNRLLFFFSGHGYNRKGGAHGYLVPTDAPDPRKDEKGFLRKALGMEQILAWCRQMEARHALFLFDSCFSGTIFRSKALPKTPPHISRKIAEPTRQFITAGAAGEEVPAKSVFTPCFIAGLAGEADLSRDSFITGTELGMYLQDRVAYYDAGQTPQYGKIRDPDLDKGDFVFTVGTGEAPPPPPPPAPPQTVFTITSSPPGADVYIDGEKVGVTPLAVPNPPSGEVPVMIAKEGFKPMSKDVNFSTALRDRPLHITLTPQTAGLEVTVVDATGAPAPNVEILVGGASKGRTGPDGRLSVADLASARYTVTAQSDEYDPASVAVNVPLTGVARATITVKPVPGKILVTTAPAGAEVFLDDRSMGRADAPLTLRDVPAGAHKVRVSLDGYDAAERTVTVKPKKTETLALTLNERTEPPFSLPRGFSSVGSSTDPASGAPNRIRHDATGYELVLVPAGEFTMGSDDASDEKPIHRVALDAYYIGVTEVTNAQYRRFKSSHTSGDFSGQNLNGENQPVVNVNWDDAKAWCEWAGMSLPTEAQWEKAARGTDGRKYPWGSEWNGRIVNFADKSTSGFGWSHTDKTIDDGYAVSAPVGSFSQNKSPYGCLDMAGNVWEWCSDWYDESYYGKSPRKNPQGASSGSYRVLRGGGWYNSAGILRAPCRLRDVPSNRNDFYGFRSCLVVAGLQGS